MRVRISYGVEIEEVPDHAYNLGHNALVELKECVRSLERSLEHIDESEGDYTPLIVSIEKVRLKLTKADLTLTDTSSILEGLQNYHNGENNVPERRSTMDTSGSNVAQTEST